MDTRREFLKKAAMLAGTAGMLGGIPASVQRAFAIDPEPGTTVFDAEHIVILMQENRSFDHAYGTLQGVRGYDDPRAIKLPNENPVWLQTNSKGETFAPFRLDIKETNVTWLGSLPHSWTDQVDARNHGRHDRWLNVKRSGHEECRDMPFTLGHYTRDDIPFYYALADAFTICDQHFCSSLTGTMPNRLYFWTGTIRGVKNNSAPAKVQNGDVEYEDSANWITFPERLEELNVPWRIYQNELSVGVGFDGEEDAWLANYGDNPLEWFTQYHARFLPAHRDYIDREVAGLPKRIEELEGRLKALPQNDPKSGELRKALDKARSSLESFKKQQAKWSKDNYEKLTAREKSVHARAFTTNVNDPDYHQLTTLEYRDGGADRKVQVPKGDVLHQFRKDVETGKLPTVSWIVAPENFSDHPSAAWYGAWYVSEVMDILTKNPEVWKKTVFILTYDENDGYFDHQPPFMAPNPRDQGTGMASGGIDTSEDFVSLQEELKVKDRRHARESSIGLGYRVPLVIASPWSRGGFVCSQVYDHTSCLQFLEKFISRKAGRNVEETNISDWRRTICGDLTAAFRPYNGEKMSLPKFLERDATVKGIHQAQFKKLPGGYKALSAEEIAEVREQGAKSMLLARQERGTRGSRGLPYELQADGAVDREKGVFEITFAAKKDVFGDTAAGSPFTAYGRGLKAGAAADGYRCWAFGVKAGDSLKYHWPLNDFEGAKYHLRIDGPNGFHREFKGGADDPRIEIVCGYKKAGNGGGLSGDVQISVRNKSGAPPVEIVIGDNAYGHEAIKATVEAGTARVIDIPTAKSFRWYDFTVKVAGKDGFEWRYAGRVETGTDGFTDPVIGRV